MKTNPSSENSKRCVLPPSVQEDSPERNTQEKSIGSVVSPIRNMELSRIKVDSRLQCRANLNQATVDYYAERMKAGDKFPPLEAFEIDTELLIADGGHRHLAAVKAGLIEFPVRIHRGTLEDALRYALRANANHGLHRSNRDKRHAVEVALREFDSESDHAIAEMCKVSHVLVGKIRRQLVTVTSSGPRVGRDGKTRKLPQKGLVNDPKASEAPNRRLGESKVAQAAQRGLGLLRELVKGENLPESEKQAFWRGTIGAVMGELTTSVQPMASTAGEASEIVSFRLPLTHYNMLSEMYKSAPPCLVKSEASFARKIVRDFVAGRLRYTNEIDRLVDLEEHAKTR